VARKEFPRKVKAAAKKRAAGKCEKCHAVLKTGEGEVDHILEDGFGGEPVLANAQVLCGVCHKAKTAQGIRLMREADRRRDKGTGAIKPKGGFARVPKAERPGKPPVPRQGGIRFWPITGHSESGD
jgi:5-methylcytosine-specific restriction endonuclease McrA